MGELNVALLIISAILLIVFAMFFIITSGNNTKCHSCGAELPLGHSKNYSIKLKNGRYKNVCRTCDKKIYT